MRINLRPTAALGLAGFLALTAPTFVQAATTGNGDPDHGFSMKAAEAGMTEVALGKLAASKAMNPDVKAYGQRMVDDHTKAGDKLKAIAATKGMTLPAALPAEAQSLHDKLSKASGAEFDKMYMKHMTMDHQKVIAAFETESKSGKDADLKSFATETLPTLREHLKMAQAAADKVGASSMK